MKESVLDEPVSHFKNYFSNKHNGIVILREWLTTDAYKSEIIELRNADKAKRDEIKAILPAITVSGVFEPTRHTNNLMLHSGLICIDIDQQDNPHIDNITGFKEDFADLEEVAFCGLSASGKGLYVIMPIEIPELHREYFISVETIYKKTFDITIDKACKDVSRLRGISYDPDCYINDNAAVFKTLPQPENTGSFQPFNGTANNTAVNDILNSVMRHKTDITATRGEWFQICSVLVNTFGENGRQLFHAFSQYHPKYSVTQTNKLFDDVLEREPYDYTVGTLVHIARNYGIVS